MTAQKGRDLLLKLKDENEIFITVAGLKTQRFSLGNETIDVTNAQSPGQWRELLNNAGTKRASLNAAGIFVDEASDELMREIFFNSGTREWQIIIPDFGILQGKFLITALEYSAQFDREIAFDISLESAGEVTFTAV